MSKLVVVGGGISGLATAFLASRESERSGLPLEVTVLESNSRPGGKMFSE
ncbi:MAG: FAD-dependent oxidoreductase, partial [Deltaproteobacteria bacterium]|nr:FAD-dependent oxidoreductase [Deltaproteobacteria bacterium]